MRLSEGNLQKLEADQFKGLPRQQRREQMLKLAQMKVAAQEDASHLLSMLSMDLEASSAGRPGTGKSSAAASKANGMERPPSTAGSVRSVPPSIAGSLSTRIQDSLLASEMRARVNARKAGAAKSGATAQNVIDLSEPAPTSKSRVDDFFAQLHAQNARPGTAASQQSQQLSRPGTAASQRSEVSVAASHSRPPTASQPHAAEEAAARAGPELLPPIIDYSELLPAHIVEGFREEFRAKKAAELAEAEAAAAGELATSAAAPAPLGELHLNGARPGTGGSGGSAARPLTGHSQYSMGSKKSTPSESELVVKAWAKKGRKPVVNRAAMSSIGECLAWQGN